MEIPADEEKHVRAFHTERTELIRDGSVCGTGLTTTWLVEAVYHAVGHASSLIPGLPFNEKRHAVPNIEGRVAPSPDSLPEDALLEIYATGWIKRGPVGLIGLTKPDAQQTIAHLVKDADEGRLHARTSEVGHEAMIALLEGYGAEYTTWQGWEFPGVCERRLGGEYGELPKGRGMRKRMKVMSRRATIDISRGRKVGADLAGKMGEMGVPGAPEYFEDYSGPSRCF